MIKQVKSYSNEKYCNGDTIKIYGISQNPDTKDYIIIQDVVYFSGNKKIDNFIKEMHLKIESHEDVVFEWISYNQLNNIEEISRGNLATIYSAIWNDGPLYYNDKDLYEYTRKPNKKVALQYIHNSQNITNKFLNKV